MDLVDLIKPDAVIPVLKATTKKEALKALAHFACELSGLDERTLFDALQHRERLSSTGMGKGVAIPHVRIDGIESVLCIFAKLDEPIDFEALDGEPVDLLFLLLAPATAGADHLNALARISRLTREPGTIEKMRGCKTRAALYSVLTEPLASSNAA
jgi:nitrogen PTS system EIIA component